MGPTMDAMLLSNYLPHFSKIRMKKLEQRNKKPLEQHQRAHLMFEICKLLFKRQP